MATEPSWSDGGQGGGCGGEMTVQRCAPTRFPQSRSSCRVSVGFIMWSFSSSRREDSSKFSVWVKGDAASWKEAVTSLMIRDNHLKHFYSKPSFNVAIQFISLLQEGAIKMHCGGGWVRLPGCLCASHYSKWVQSHVAVGHLPLGHSCFDEVQYKAPEQNICRQWP